MSFVRTFLLLLCLAVATTAGAQQYSSDNRKAVRHFEKAIAQLQQSDMDHAEQSLRAALKEDDRFAEAHLQLADLCFDHQRYAEAVEHYEVFLQLDRRHKRWRADAERNRDIARFRIDAMAHPVDFQPVNLGPQVNSVDDDYLPAITADAGLVP